MDKETAELLADSNFINSTDDNEYNYVSYQVILAQEWLKDVRKCKCDLDETSDDCKHIRKAIKKQFGKKIDEMWNRMLKQQFESANTMYGFKIPYELQKRLST